MKEILKKMWKIVKIVAVFVWRNRRGGCLLGWRNLGWRKDSPAAKPRGTVAMRDV